MTGLLAVGALAACSSGPTYNAESVILTYEVDGIKKQYTADDLFGEAVINPEHAEQMFNEVYKLVVRNYFTIENPDGEGSETGSKQMDEINRLAANSVQIDKDTAEKNSKTNGTSYKSEFESILSSKGCEDEDELKAYYVFEEQQAKFKENYYKIYADENNGLSNWKGYNLLRDGSSKANDARNPRGYSGYLETKVPYHISHILVNVDDSGSNNYWNGTISAANAEHLYRVIKGLTSAKTFGEVAFQESDDGSKSNFGDLGIVDKDKATEESDKYVKEFILGLYTYENKYNQNSDVLDRVADSNIAPSDSILEALEEVYTQGGKDRPNYIDVSDFEELYNERNVEGSLVIGSTSQNFYPRNIKYNQVFNNHGLSLIVNNALTAEEGNFKKFTIDGEDKYVLCAHGTSTPVLVTRAGASYQGIHFIVVNRSPFEGEGNEMSKYTVDGVKLSEYYTTKYPKQAGYPVDANNKPLRTYVNTIDSSDSKYKERADAVDQTIKSFDSNIEREIYKQYVNVKGVKLNFVGDGKKIEKTINDWIERSKNEKSDSTFDSWEDYWTEYIDMLKMQKEQSSKKLVKGCAVAFSKASKAKTQAALSKLRWNKNTLEAVADGTALSDTIVDYEQLFNEIGGACNDGEKH